jgi:hypothetical protein
MKGAGVLALVLLGALPGSAAGAPVVQTPSVERSATLAAGAKRTLTLTCPGTSVAVGGAAPSGFATLRGSVPLAEAQRWRFRFAAGNSARRVTASLRCVGLRLPAGTGPVRLLVSSRFEPDVEVGAGETGRVALACPASQVATGWGFERADAALGVAAAVPTRTGWSLAFRNRGRTAASVTPHIRCLERRQRTRRGQSHAFALRRASFADALGGGLAAVSHSCRRSEGSLATGFRPAASDGAAARAAAPAGPRGGRWSFAGASGRVETTLLCLSRATGFG